MATRSAPVLSPGLGVSGPGVPDVSGGSYESAFATLRAAGLSPTAGRLVVSSLPEGQVAYTYPRAGATARPGTTVYVYRSLG